MDGVGVSLVGSADAGAASSLSGRVTGHRSRVVVYIIFFKL
jgi:hypothetical protein